MARKSRRNKNVEAVSNQIIENCENLIDTGAYIRLSVENGGNETDETLVVQQMLVEKFIEEHPDLKLAGTYIDNGFSGTNFERPGYLKLMEDVRSGKIQCIVVKDLSRFGRDYLETGYYLETILPRLNVRFIAITDDYDSSRKEDRENISVPLKNMVNAMYAKDMSKKILAAKDAQRKKGNITLSKVAFGYVRSEDRHRQIIDEEVYIQILVNQDNKRMVVRKCEENDKDALRWCVAKPDKRKSRKMTNKIFSAMMYEMMGWNLDCRYKILGHKITFEDETIYVFDLMETEIFLDIKGKRAKKDTESQTTIENANNIEETASSDTDTECSAEEIKRKNRIPFYPKEWKDSFGLPVEEHRKALEINMLDGYAEFTTGK